jgi:hypothetical protein
MNLIGADFKMQWIISGNAQHETDESKNRLVRHVFNALEG